MTVTSRARCGIDHLLELTIVGSFSRVGFAGAACAVRLGRRGCGRSHGPGRRRHRRDGRSRPRSRASPRRARRRRLPDRPRRDAYRSRTPVSVLDATRRRARRAPSSPTWRRSTQCGPRRATWRCGAAHRRARPQRGRALARAATNGRRARADRAGARCRPVPVDDAACSRACARATDARVITVSSGGMYTQRARPRRLRTDRPNRSTVSCVREQRNAAQVVLNELWSRHPAGRGSSFHAMHPGWADTPGVQSRCPGFDASCDRSCVSAEQGADTMAWLAGAPEARGIATARSGSIGGAGRRRCCPGPRTSDAEPERLWDWCVDTFRRRRRRSRRVVRIAIVGTGVSGLVAAHRLHADHDLTIFEADARTRRSRQHRRRRGRRRPPRGRHRLHRLQRGELSRASSRSCARARRRDAADRR